MIDLKIPVQFVYNDAPAKRLSEANKQAKAAIDAQRREAQQQLRLQKDIEKAERARLKGQEQEAKRFFEAQRAEAQQNAKLEAELKKREMAAQRELAQQQRAQAAEQKAQQRAILAEQKAQQRAILAEQKAQQQAARAAYQAQRREAAQQLQLERDIERAQRRQVQELKEQIAQRRRLNSLTRRLDRELAGPTTPRGIGPAGVTGGVLAAGIIDQVARAALDFARQSEQLGAQAAGAEARLTALTGSAERYEAIISQAKEATQGTISEVEAASSAFLLLESGLAKSDAEAVKLAKAAGILVPIFEAQGASQEKFVRLLSSGNVALLDNFNLTSAQVTARSKLIQETQGLSADEARLVAIRELLIEKSEELEATLSENELSAKRLDAAYKDLSANIGRLVGPAFLQMREDAAETLGALNSLLGWVEPWLTKAQQLAEAQSRIEESNTGLAGTLQTVADYLNEYASPLGWLPGKGTEFIRAVTGMAVGNEELAKTFEQVKEEAEKIPPIIDDATDAIEEGAEEWEKARKKFARDLVGIDEKAREDSEGTWDDYFDKEQDAWQDHQKRIEQIKKQAAKDLARSDRDLQKDLSKVAREEQKDIRRIREDAAREEKQERRRKQIDAAADERLFNFELKQLAAAGEGNRILEMLERRKIEEEIARDKAGVEQQIEDEKQQVEIERVRETAAEKRQELRQNAAEERDLRRQALEEQLAEERTNYDERRADLVKWREEKLGEIEAARIEAIEELGKELAESEEITKAQLKELKDIAGRQGVDVGKALADGINQGYAENLLVSGLLGDDTPSSGAGGAGGGRGASSRGRNQNLARTGPQFGFQFGGEFTVGGSGGADSQLVQFMATPGERVTVTPQGQGAAGPQIVINASGVGIDRLVAILNQKTQEALQEYTDTVLAPALR